MSVGVVTPGSYTMKVAITQRDNQTEQYEALKKAAGDGRRMSDCAPYLSHYKVQSYYLPGQSLSNYLN